MKKEIAVCAYCKNEFERRVKKNPKKTCDGDKCKKLKSLMSKKETPASLNGVNNYCSPYRADFDYHGKPY